MISRIFQSLGYLCLLGALVSFFYYWDPTRIFFMGLKSKNSFAFEELPKEITKYDIEKTLTLTSSSNLEDKRAQLRNSILGKQKLEDLRPYRQMRIYKQEFAEKYPAPICLFEPSVSTRMYCQLAAYKQWSNLDAIFELSTDFDPAYIAKSFLFTPLKSNGHLVLYHHGYAGTFHQQKYFLEKLNEQGFTVIAFNMISYGDHPNNIPDPWMYAVNGKLDQVKHPQEVIFKPVFASLNHALDTQKIQHVHMMGLSAGGWVTAVSAALDPRIEKSYPIAGVLPIGLRHGDKERASPQFYKPMLETASYLDMFALAADRPGRSQMQIFNRYDRCCFNNTRGKLYEDIVQNVTGGDFSVLIDETHARHKISSWAFDKILKDLAQ
ncbi:alpha/beta fold hydrolase [Terasakiella sp. SH-1]|uniref:alpha/beta fold hydrolase n=1 Tax=Terasakiella sp. SH-1 TaxID=2560057 RepID=UPI0010737FC5|nr:alpha/beta fold hydrolase [Terasakiella sp. SH-1]